MAPTTRFERATPGLGGSCSILLSYVGRFIDLSLIVTQMQNRKTLDFSGLSGI